MLYDLSDQHIKNIHIFLKRITLSPDEALPYLQIVQVLSNPIKPVEKPKLKKVDKDDIIESEVK